MSPHRTDTPADLEKPRSAGAQGIRREKNLTFHMAASLRAGPSAVAVPYGTGGALRGAAWFPRAGGPKAVNPRGAGGLVPQGFCPKASWG